MKILWRFQNGFQRMPNIQYTSPTMQHEVIEVLGTIVKNKIVEECKKSGIFCVSMDGTEDNSATEMEVIVLRYWSEKINDVTEHALSMFPARDRTAKALTDNLLSELDSAGLSSQHRWSFFRLF